MLSVILYSRHVPSEQISGEVTVTVAQNMKLLFEKEQTNEWLVGWMDERRGMGISYQGRPT